MIGWKCKWGVYLGALGTLPSSLNDFTWVDVGVVTMPIVQKVVSYDVRKATEIETVAGWILEALGDDYYSMYGAPLYVSSTTSISAGSYYLLKDYLPSMTLSCPNLWSDYSDVITSDNGSGVIVQPRTGICVFFPTLDRLIYIQYKPQFKSYLFTVNNDTITNLGIMDGATFLTGIGDAYDTQSANSSLGIISEANYYHWGLIKYESPSDLIDYRNYYGFSVEYNARSGDNYIRYEVEVYPATRYPSAVSIKEFLEAFFTTSPTNPDFEGELPPPPDPLDPIGPSGPGGGGGNFDNDSDIIADSSLPTISAADTGFTRIYSPTLSQVQDLAQYLWTDETVVETIWNKIKQLLENPMDAIISFSLVPVPVQISGTKNFALAYIDTGVAMNTVANQFVDVDCGTFELKEYYGSALDYSPNTKVSCFLPFIGVVTLNTDEVMNTTLTVRYRVDIVSGSCVAKIFVNESCLYQFSGHCSIPIPISAADFSSYLSAAIGVAKLAIGAAVGGGAGAAAAGASEVDVEQATRGVEISEGMSREQEMAAYQSAFDTYRENNQSAVTTASFRGISAQNVTNVVGTVMGSKLHVEHSGSFSGNTGYLGIRRPYLIIQRPRMCMPNEYRLFNGYPSMITLNIGDCKGYTKVQQVQLKNVPATNPEQSEIMQLLKGGIII